ncbi:MAG TPA: hypothetical protein PLE00_07020 [Anaerolineaceae bacterium]|nr:hypothetical protein [Anaerolineaceae bacterium]
MRHRNPHLLLICLLALSACGVNGMASIPTASLQPATRTPTFTPTATATPAPTNTHTPIPSATPLPPTATLTLRQQREARLYQASLHYLADTPEQADLVAREIDFASDPHESADNACGPLTVAIMRDGGYLPQDANPHDMWLLCPREDNPECHGLEILNQKFFPQTEYDYIRINESIGSYDWAENPLQPGDWLYLFVRKGISKYEGFDHMLVVTRVDDHGRAYSVTNINKGDGFVIQEELLYDPRRPGQGLFSELTNDKLRKELGMTGTAGFLLIRAKANPLP